MPTAKTENRDMRATRDLTNGANGYFCVSEDDKPVIQGEVRGEDVAIWVMADRPVQIDKMFGPLVFMPIRVRADFESCEWIIEREGGPDDEWREVARVPGQLESDFEEAGPST